MSHGVEEKEEEEKSKTLFGVLPRDMVKEIMRKGDYGSMVKWCSSSKGMQEACQQPDFRKLGQDLVETEKIKFLFDVFDALNFDKTIKNNEFSVRFVKPTNGCSFSVIYSPYSHLAGKNVRIYVETNNGLDDIRDQIDERKNKLAKGILENILENESTTITKVSNKTQLKKEDKMEGKLQIECYLPMRSREQALRTILEALREDRKSDLRIFITFDRYAGGRDLYDVYKSVGKPNLIRDSKVDAKNFWITSIDYDNMWSIAPKINLTASYVEVTWITNFETLNKAMHVKGQGLFFPHHKKQ